MISIKMTFSESIEVIGRKIYNKITEPKLVKLSTIIALIVGITSVFIGVIVAMIGPPGGYNPFDNYVSDLGGSPHTPFPYFLDIASIVSGILLVPTLFYMEKLLVPLPKNEEALRNISLMRKRVGIVWFVWMLAGLIGWIFVGMFTEDQTTYYYLRFYGLILCFSSLVILLVSLTTKIEKNLDNTSRMRIRLGHFAFISMLTGLIGWFFVGVFSEDRTTIYYLHFYATVLFFSGLALGGFFFGLIVAFYDTPFPRFLGLYMMIVPTIAGVIFLITLLPIVEWTCFFINFGWMITGFMLLLKYINRLEE